MAEPVCPYCRMAFDEASPPRIFCTACGMPHHEDCYLENGGCTVFGCKRAPADDPKLQVSQSDLSAVSCRPSSTLLCAICSCGAASRLRCKAINRRVIVGRWVYRKRPLLRPRKFRPPRRIHRSRQSPRLMLLLRRLLLLRHLCFCCARLCFHAQEPDKLHCPWHFSRRAGNTQFLCRIHGPCGRTTVPYCFDAGLSRHRVVDLGHHRNLHRGKGQHRPSFQLSAWVTNEILHSAPTQ